MESVFSYSLNSTYLAGWWRRSVAWHDFESNVSSEFTLKRQN